MFSFHKPRVYRSTEGCCICRAKSSSSRFTDSKKYENDSMKCFDLKQPRFGEICNACVLLVKRYKRLPVGSNRHWGHVVDARAGPGTKSLTKYKKNKDETYSTGHQQTQNGKSLFPEKFSKIFKKNKKVKSSSGKKDSSTGSSSSSKRKTSTSTSAHNWENHQSLPSTPDSLDSDYEDHNTSSPSSTVVQFQTQTRASSYRSRNSSSAASANSVAHKKRLVKLSGSRRRKCLPPRKNRHRAIENVQFFDESEWQERKSCCGMVYECVSLGGALIVDLEHYKPCLEHQSIKCNATMREAEQQQTSSGQQQQAQKTIIATMPAVVQLATATTSVSSVAATTTISTKPPVNQKPNPTPVLKKHHLFFKRQSECFPHADLSAMNHSNNTNSNTNQMTTTTTTTATKTDLQISTAATTSTTTAISLKTSSDLTSPSNLSVSIAPTSSSTPSPPITPRNPSAKITTLSPTPTMVTAATPLHSSNYNSSNKSNSFLHKIKADTGKIVKHSLEKINTAVRIKSSDLSDMRHMIKTVDKSYLLTKPHQPSPVSQTQQAQHHANISIVNPSQPLTSATLSSSSSSSSSATKFSDNSSDSGFDENLQDRKSASPLQEDTEKKMLTRPGVQTMFLASGVQIQGQQQNLILTGNEVAAKILQNRKQHSTTSAHQHNNNRPSSTATTAVKIAQIVGGTSHKMRAIYNNNAIQHENGVTTIVPASSLAASSQTAAMAALAPSTVTITPSPPIATTISNLNGKKLSAAGHCVIGINASGGNSSAATGVVSHQSHIVGGSVTGTHLNTIGNNVSSLNQKIILVKTAKYNNNNNNSNVLATTSSSSSSSSAAAATTGFHNSNNNHNTTTTTSVCKN